MNRIASTFAATAIAIGSLAVATPVFAAASSFQNSCSNIDFVYEGDNAALSATCLRANGTPNPSVVLIGGISNQNGQLTASGGASSFQKSCGNIQVQVQEGQVFLTALCRTTNGSSQPSKIELQDISNQNGVLTN